MALDILLIHLQLSFFLRLLGQIEGFTLNNHIRDDFRKWFHYMILCHVKWHLGLYYTKGPFH